MARKRHKHEEEHIDESWLIPYADLLTLLLALFIVLFAMSSVDIVKFRTLADSLNSALNGSTGVLKYPDMVKNTNPNSVPKVVVDNAKDDKQAHNLEIEELKKLQEKMNAYIKQKSLDAKLKTKLSDEGLLVVILDDALFDSGSAVIRENAKQLAFEMSTMLATDPPREIVISGHTDNVPIHNAKYESNWELSVIRAVHFMKIILKNPSLDPKLLSAKGYGEQQPVASNNTKEGRAKNRRVEVLIRPLK